MARKKTTVELRHPKANRTYQAPPSAVEFWESKGWKRVGDSSPAKATTTAKAVEKKES